MREMMRTMGAVLATHGPALVSWYLAGVLGRYLAIALAAEVGVYVPLVGTLLVALGVLCRLVAFVAMLLVARDCLRQLGLVAPAINDGRTQRKLFVDALIAGIIPFLAFYLAWGYLRTDFQDYARRASERWVELQWTAVDLGATSADGAGTISDLSAISGIEVTPLTITLCLVAFAGRWAWKKYRERVPSWTAIVAILLELLWTFLFAMMLSEIIDQIAAWVDSRVALVWIGDLRQWLAATVAPVAWVWTGIEWVITEAVGLVALPLAWMAIAGTVYGVTIAADNPRLDSRVTRAARSRFTRLPEAVRARMTDVGQLATSRVAPLWGVYDALMILTVAIVLEPLRIALVVSAYDVALGRVSVAAAERRSESEAQEAGAERGHLNVEREGPDGIVGHEIGQRESD